ncbi:hypothetical protein ND748_00270 [Frankia sp. AiPs1]|uniref:hypothetical protein n=1 Tax=Frankia sp. AiPs1 TaxID=573493 RepID=UPI0020446ADB|nr:hypothetical protein [Frankia sp. AiPs1]MCM3920131.1 hypothetical protein [Frankia sp. AiPs1]
MSVDVYLGLSAIERGRAVARAARRHVHLAAEPFVVVGYHLPGDPGAPIGLLYGTRREQPTVIGVGEPRDPKLRFAQLAQFAMALNGYVAQFVQPSASSRRPQDTRVRMGGPQLIVANQATAQWLCDLMGRRLRYLRSEGDWPVHPSLPTAGAHLSFFAGQRVPGSSLVLPLTEVLAQHWTTGQLAALNANIASQLAWISDPDSLEEAERALPAGPVPDPEWEALELHDAIKAYGKLVESRPAQANRPMIQAIDEALRPSWQACWHALDLLADLPPAERTRDRWSHDVHQWNRHTERVSAGTAYFRKRPKQLQVFRYLTRLERLTADLNREMALDDPLIMAGYVASGEALSGDVVAVDLSGRPPRLQVRPHLPFLRPIGTDVFWHPPQAADVRSPGRPPVVSLTMTGTTTDGDVTFNVTAGAIQKKLHHRLPRPGQQVVFSPFGPRDYHQDTLPAELPWTHADDQDGER